MHSKMIVFGASHLHFFLLSMLVVNLTLCSVVKLLIAYDLGISLLSTKNGCKSVG